MPAPAGSMLAREFGPEVRNSHRCCLSLPTSRGNSQHAVFSKRWIVVEARDFSWSNQKNSCFQFAVVSLREPAEDSDKRRFNTLHRLDRGVNPAEVNVLSESEAIGMKETQAAIGIHRVAECLANRFRHVAAKVIRLHTQLESDFQRHILSRTDLEIVTGQFVASKEVTNASRKCWDESGAATRLGDQVVRVTWINTHEDGVPASGPTKTCNRPRDFRQFLRGCGIITLNHGPELLGAKCGRRKLPYLFICFSINSIVRRQRVAYSVYGGPQRRHRRLDRVGQRFSADISSHPIADAIHRLHRRSTCRTTTVFVVAEANCRSTILSHFNRKLLGRLRAIE